jgi:hypothetical protein
MPSGAADPSPLLSQATSTWSLVPRGRGAVAIATSQGAPYRWEEAQLIWNATSLEAQSGDDIESSVAAIC